MAAAFFQPHLLKNMGDGITHSRGWRQGEIHNAERHIEPLGGLVGDELAHAGDFKRSALNQIRHAGQIAVRRLGERRAHHAGAGNAHVDHHIGGMRPP